MSKLTPYLYMNKAKVFVFAIDKYELCAKLGASVEDCASAYRVINGTVTEEIGECIGGDIFVRFRMDAQFLGNRLEATP
ncbi:MAG: hypothetical protein P4N59_11600 [Negativicutes bacterium]|nr:hypothetical protein [Negativicutes bacterium]